MHPLSTSTTLNPAFCTSIAQANPVGPAPTFLGEGKIHADAVDLHVGQLAGFFIEPLGLRIAHRSVERGHYAENPNTASRSCQIDVFK